MKIVVINGSPKGSHGNTNVIASAFLDGAKEVGAEVVSVFLADKNIEHCKGCHICWSRGPMQCVTNDDMLEVISHMAGASIICFASPVYFANISGMLKVFFDRMTMIGSPHGEKKTKEPSETLETAPMQLPKLMMLSTCGHPDQREFEVTSLWIKQVAQKMNMDLVGEIYAAQAKLLQNPPEELAPVISYYLKLVAQAGKEIANHRTLSEATAQMLDQAKNGFETMSKLDWIQ